MKLCLFKLIIKAQTLSRETAIFKYFEFNQFLNNYYLLYSRLK